MANQIQVFLILCIYDRDIDSIIAIGNSVPDKNHYSFIKLQCQKVEDPTPGLLRIRSKKR